jgi:hypothetical protein
MLMTGAQMPTTDNHWKLREGKGRREKVANLSSPPDPLVVSSPVTQERGLSWSLRLKPAILERSSTSRIWCSLYSSSISGSIRRHSIASCN